MTTAVSHWEYYVMCNVVDIPTVTAFCFVYLPFIHSDTNQWLLAVSGEEEHHLLESCDHTRGYGYNDGPETE